MLKRQLHGRSGNRRDSSTPPFCRSTNHAFQRSFQIGQELFRQKCCASRNDSFAVGTCGQVLVGIVTGNLDVRIEIKQLITGDAADVDVRAHRLELELPLDQFELTVTLPNLDREGGRPVCTGGCKYRSNGFRATAAIQIGSANGDDRHQTHRHDCIEPAVCNRAHLGPREIVDPARTQHSLPDCRTPAIRGWPSFHASRHPL